MPASGFGASADPVTGSSGAFKVVAPLLVVLVIGPAVLLIALIARLASAERDRV